MTRRRGRPPSQRQLRVGEELRHVLASVIERGTMHDPELRDVPITVTEVRMSPDLKNATAFVTPLGGALNSIDADRLTAALARAAPYFRGQVGRNIRLKFTPKLRFEMDTTFEAAGRIDALLRRPSVARDLDPGFGPGPGPGPDPDSDPSADPGPAANRTGEKAPGDKAPGDA